MTAALGASDPDAAHANRAAIPPVLAGIPGCLGLAADDVVWSNGGDYAPLFPDDAVELRGICSRGCGPHDRGLDGSIPACNALR
jgi:hypothetical protein